MVKKISIIGSGGVGSNLAFNILSGLRIEELVLVDINQELAKGIGLDLEDTRLFLGFNTTIKGTDDFALIEDSDIVIIACGQTRKEGMERIDLLKANVEIARDVSYKIKQFSPHSIVIVVTNPVDFITYIVKKEIGGKRERVFGVGSSLDSARLVNLIYKETKVSANNIESCVIGLHNKEMIPLISQAKIRGIDINTFLNKDRLNFLKEKVSLRGAEIVGLLKKRSAYFAPALASYKIVEAIAKDKNEIICLSVYLNGEYGLNDVCMGVPCLINKEGIGKIFILDLNEEEKRKVLRVKDYFEECMKLV